MSGILIVADQFEGALRDITREIVTAAVELKSQWGGKISLAIVSDGSEGAAASANLEGVDEVIVCNVGSNHFDAGIYEEVTCALGAELRPSLILFGHTSNGMACASGVAARLGSGFSSDVFGLKIEEGELVATRAAYGNKLCIDLSFPGKRVVVLTMRAATFKAASATGAARIVQRDFDPSQFAQSSTHIEYVVPPASNFDVSAADFILAVGRGVGEEKNLPRFMELATKIGATFGCSRPIVDAGWLPKPYQIGQSGKTASNCKLYIALGISGAVQHLHGMKHVETIVAINTDPAAPMFNVATYGAALDIFAFADALERRFN
ncbi:electron transfer flavoprotein subunit alpha/FixB family protein [Bradyrhizobium sp.]|uniref:electron transfer flavoprotein subunit alpha/FixB family protein n=1 Tax=Bradyrhizobium sp. TaxID=376 RepID=UPI0039E6DD3D